MCYQCFEAIPKNINVNNFKQKINNYYLLKLSCCIISLNYL